jgi:hypothetical protein
MEKEVDYLAEDIPCQEDNCSTNNFSKHHKTLFMYVP